MSQFRSTSDEEAAINFLLGKLSDRASTVSLNKVSQHHSIDAAVEILELRREILDGYGTD